MTRQLAWVHISDLHIRTTDETQYDLKMVREALLADLKSLRADSGLAFDCVFFTGDLAFSGKTAEYQLAAAFFDGLVASTGVPLDRVYC